MKYVLIETDRDGFCEALNKAAGKGCKPIWETYKQYISTGSEICSVIVEDPEGQTTLTERRKPRK